MSVVPGHVFANFFGDNHFGDNALPFWRQKLPLWRRTVCPTGKMFDTTFDANLLLTPISSTATPVAAPDWSHAAAHVISKCQRRPTPTIDRRRHPLLYSPRCSDGGLRVAIERTRCKCEDFVRCIDRCQTAGRFCTVAINRRSHTARPPGRETAADEKRRSRDKTAVSSLFKEQCSKVTAPKVGIKYVILGMRFIPTDYCENSPKISRHAKVLRLKLVYYSCHRFRPPSSSDW
jgi:hypothetical protein